MHGIAGDVILALVLGAFAVFCAAMIWAGIVMAATEPVPPRRPVTATGAPAAPPPAAAGPAAAPPGRDHCPTAPRPTG